MARTCRGCDEYPEPPGKGWRICAGCVAMLARLTAIHGPDTQPKKTARPDARCVKCQRPAAEGITLCQHHREQSRRHRQRREARLRELEAHRSKPPEVCGYKGCKQPATHGRYCGPHHDRRNLELRAAGRFAGRA